MSKIQNSKKYDLEDRTLKFAQDIRELVKNLSLTVWNREDCKQLIRSSGSVGANYREANEAISKKDFLLRIKICRKEAKETTYWLQLIDTENNARLNQQREMFIQESKELMMIFSSIMRKSE